MRVLRDHPAPPPLRPTAFETAIRYARAEMPEAGEPAAIEPIMSATGIPHLFPLRIPSAAGDRTCVVNRRVDGTFVVARPDRDRFAAPDDPAVIARTEAYVDAEIVPLVAPGARATDAGVRGVVDSFYAFEIGGVAYLAYALFGRDLRRVGMTFGPGFGDRDRRLAASPLVLDRAPVLGRHLLYAGGDTIVTNPHFVSREMRYAVDLIPLDEGSRTVVAPAAGTVTAAVDGFADDLPRDDPARAANPLGNHVRIRSDERDFVFAHLARGSVAVGAGRGVGAGEVLGLIGDSGRSAEPHLHFHVSTSEDVPHGVPLRFRAGEELWEPRRGAVIEQSE